MIAPMTHAARPLDVPDVPDRPRPTRAPEALAPEDPAGTWYPGALRPVRRRLRLVYAWVAASLLYFAWRVGFTLDFGHIVWSALFLGAEVLLFALGIPFYVNVAGGSRRADPPPPAATGTVDILIATYNEDLDLVRRTALAARDARLPHSTWICDDGRRPEMRALADELGVGYLDRPDNRHFKAGNLNNALDRTRGEYVLVLDADHVVRPEILERTVGWFREPRVGLVQIPQVYYNVDSFQHAGGAGGWHESMLFQHAIQPGSAGLNASFFVGTGAVLRRAALDEVGGIATGTITEDIHTSLRMHQRGWGSVYVDEVLGVMLAPETPLAYVVQRLRWARGSFQVLRAELPTLGRGLTAWQLVSYLGSLTVWLSAWARLVLYLAPALYLLADVSPFAAPAEVALPVLIVKMIVDMAVFQVLTRPLARVFASECFQMIGTPIGLVASAALVWPSGLKFAVTPKGDHFGLPPLVLAPLLALLALEVSATGVGIARGLADRLLWGQGMLALAFTAWFSVVAAYTLLYCYQRRSAKDRFSFPVGLPATVQVGTDGVRGVVSRLNDSTAWLTLPRAAEVGTGIVVHSDGTLGMRLAGEVVELSRLDATSWVARVQLHLSPDEHDTLMTFLFNDVFPTWLASERPELAVPPPARRPELDTHGALLPLAHRLF